MARLIVRLMVRMMNHSPVPANAFHTLTASLLIVLFSGTLIGQAYATEPDDPAWRRFQHALHQPAAIGEQSEHPMANEVTRPLPALDTNSIQPDKFLLGNDLFHERQLSRDGSAACINCHAGPISGTDGRAVSLGVDRALGRFNALTTFNANYGFRQFWDGRSITLADQAIEPILSELELASNRDDTLRFLQQDAQYVQFFEDVYPDGVTLENMQDALAHFQSINFAVTETPFQLFLRGADDTPAQTEEKDEGSVERISEQALTGWETFQRVGCTQCHNGIGLGGNSYQKAGTLRPFFSAARPASPDDHGLEERSGRERDRYTVKVPALHNVAMTAPYYHDGSESSLEVVIEEMADTQLARQLSEEDVSDIQAFLKSLTGRPYGLHHRQDIRQMSQPSMSTPSLPDSPASHQQAYLETARAVTPAMTQLQYEMERVASRDVTHFDFVQFQHRELIRFSRALRHPPGDIPPSDRSCLSSRSGQLLQGVLGLEWIIADFLRAQATLGVLTIHAEAASSQADAQLLPTAVSADELRDIVQTSLSDINNTPINSLAGKLLECAL